MRKNIATALLIMSFACSGLYADLVAHWVIEEGDGSTVSAVVSSPDADGTLVGADWLIDDLAPVPTGTSAGLTFDSANNDRVTTNYTGILGDNARTIAAWIKPDANPAEYSAFVAWGNNVNGNRITFRLNTSSGNGNVGALRFEVQGGYATAQTVVADGVWRHVAVVVEQGDAVHDVQFYVNGVLESGLSGQSGTNRAINTIVDPGLEVMFGAAPHSVGSYGYSGGLDDVRIYDHALTASEILDIIDRKKARFVSPYHGRRDVQLSTSLNWAAPLDDTITVTGYDVYLSEDPNIDGADKIYTGVDLTTSPTLSLGKTYYWRVDALGGSTGEMWKFDIMADKPFIDPANPQNQYVEENAVVTFTVSAINPNTMDTSNLSYEWFKYVDGVTDVSQGAGDTLTISNVQIAQEGKYYCKVSFTDDSSKFSDSSMANLVVRRRVGYWPFDNNLTDEEGGNDALGDPNYVAGIVGAGAVDFTLSDSVALPTVAHASGSYTISWWEYADQTPAGTWESMIASGPTTGYEIMEFDRYQTVRYAIGVDDASYGYTNTDNPYDREIWYFHAATFDEYSGIFAWYLDGVKMTTDSFTSVFTAFDEMIYVGNILDGTQPFNGYIDDLKLYNYSQDAFEVAEEYVSVRTEEEICVSQPRTDVTGPVGKPDCQVDLYDLAAIAAQWLECNWVPDCK